MTAPLVLTMGDPRGIGIEIALKAWQEKQEKDLCPFVLIGDMSQIEATLNKLGWEIPLQKITNLETALTVFEGALPVYDPGLGDNEAAQTIAAIETAVKLCQSGDASGMVTAPIQKKRLYDAGFRHPGHTEFLAALTNAEGREVMMLACPELKVIPATIHIPLKEVPNLLTPKLLEQIIRTTDQDLKSRFGITSPRIAIAGLNPHAGEGGSIGQEETAIIQPVIDKLVRKGFVLKGPMSADTMFHAKAREGYDAAICMYHDQALIPIKTIDFDGGVNVTLGLPIIRTSPDHGTADDIAGQGIANATSMIAAIKMAHEMARQSESKSNE
ncbi:MAG: 4-hydroxythreonine-4-phosphate dehydrogenase PdxA [Sneathiella sp.]|nr:4-hydroxythreonine-4-phosphate dehydrogenase PdxA [Sneathiella sp.]